MDRDIEKLARQVNGFLRTNALEIEAAETRFQMLQNRAEKRIEGIERLVLTAVPENRNSAFDRKSIAMNALVFAALSVPVSAWQDLTSASEVFDALRSVNGKYASLSDSEIWLQTFLLEPEQLAGLVSLTKGSLFEAYVADTTGGVLHEHFNTPDTDIIIDGTEYQIKATDSASYISSVEEGIPVIATSEVAATTDAFDGGITDAELERATELALGGTVIDLNDTALDAVVSGFGGLGVLATFRGINHAADRYNAGIDGEDAIIEGLEVAVAGTMKATVDLAETGYKAGQKVVTSKTSRFIGRQILRAAGAIDRKLDSPSVDSMTANEDKKR